MSLNMKDYSKDRLLGRGGQGEVWLVTNQKNGNQYAMKLIPLAKRSMKEAIALTQEVALTIRLKHPHVVEYIDYVADDDYLYILMEIMDAGDLQGILKQMDSEEKILYYMFQAMQGVAFVHQNNVVHRDLKPENILLKKNGDQYFAKLADFGLARKSGPQTFASTYCGTMFYMAPEIWEGEGYSNKMDIWSMGCILYEMCIGEPPFQGSGMMGIFKAIQKNQVVPISAQFSASLRQLCASMIQLDPLARPTAAEVLTNPLFSKFQQTLIPSLPVSLACPSEQNNNEQNNNYYDSQQMPAFPPDQYQQAPPNEANMPAFPGTLSKLPEGFDAKDFGRRARMQEQQIEQAQYLNQQQGVPNLVASVSAKVTGMKAALAQAEFSIPVDTPEEIEMGRRDPKFQRKLDIRKKFAIADSRQLGRLDAESVAEFYQQFQLDAKFAQVLIVGICETICVSRENFDQFDLKMEEIQKQFNAFTGEKVGCVQLQTALDKLGLRASKQLVARLAEHFGSSNQMNFQQFVHACAAMYLSRNIMKKFDAQDRKKLIMNQDGLMNLGLWFVW